MTNDYSKAVKHVAWAMLLGTFHITVSGLDFLPDWVGYIMIYKALTPISRYRPTANLLKPFAAVLVVFELVNRVMKLFGMSVALYAINLIIAVVYIYLNFQLMTDIYHTAQLFNMNSGHFIPVLRNITTVTYAMVFVVSNAGGHQYVIIAAAAVNIVMKLALIVHLLGHSNDAGQRDMKMQ
ncbi:MAG: hypothetical protein IJN77_10040 [Oscillospiraceae bacterium]|nr:hypothetical protein [Oscillospiraceae bacterium]